MKGIYAILILLLAGIISSHGEETAEGLFLKGVAFYNQEKLDDAIRAYEEAIKIDPNYDKAWNGKGCSLTRKGEFDQAIEAYNKAIELNGSYAEAWNNKGWTHNCQGKYDDALNDCEKAIEIDPIYADAWNNKGWALCNLNRYDEALEAFNFSIKNNDNNYTGALAYNNKGWIYVLQSESDNANQVKLEEAIKQFDTALEMNPNCTWAYINKGWALYCQANNEEAIKVCKDAIRKDPNSIWAWNNLGWILCSSLDYENAIDAFDHAIGLDPYFAWAWNNKGWTLYCKGNYDDEHNTNKNEVAKDFEGAITALDEAIEIFENIRVMNPDCAWAYNNKGLVFFSQSKYKEAIEAYKSAIAREPKCPEFFYCNEEKAYRKLSLEATEVHNACIQCREKRLGY
jgi:tetratricopeptide (TPR) repeat protein